MSRLMSLTDASRLLKRMVAADQEPILDDNAIADLLWLAAAPDRAGSSPRNVAAVGAWQASHAYAPGDLVASQGRFWRALLPGTSGTTEPGWPDLLYVASSSVQVTDHQVIWADNGGTWAPTYNLNIAAAEGWGWKAAQVAHKYTFAMGGSSFSRGQFIAHCQEREAYYRQRSIGTLDIVQVDISSINPDSARFLGLV